MSHRIPSRAWSCATLQSGLELSRALPLTMESLGEPNVEEMRRELEQLEDGLTGCPNLERLIHCH